MPHFDIIVRRGIVIDGTGAPPFRADIGIAKGKIAKIGDLSGASAEKVIDADGLIVAPGFIDMHNHSDVDIFLVPTADNFIMQGVTTIVIGNCGFSPAPVTDINRELVEIEARKLVEELGRIPWSSYGEYLEALEKLAKSVNIVPLVGHGTVRSAILGAEPKKPSGRELEEMKKLVTEAMESGAFGMSSGLIYVPSMFADTNELIELAKVVAQYGGVYASHIRNEGVGLLDAVTEAVRIGLESSAGVEISHIKASGMAAWGMLESALRIIESYASRGFDISADAYPYTASSTGLEALFPPWVREGGVAKIVERLRNAVLLERVVEELEKRGIMEERYLEWNQIVVARSESHPELEGRSIEEIAKLWGLDPARAAAKLLVDDGGTTMVVIHSMSEHDVEKAIAHPLVAIGSDGSVKRFGEGKPHPRNYGAFPRVIAEYVKKRKVLSLVEAIRKMTSLPARKLGLWDRGIIRPGFSADIVVFNYYTIRDTATYDNPHSYPKGIEYVLVNGVLVVENGRHTGAKPGILLKKS